nr:4-hydroxy-3-methylbut-2-enyl diphosphate reductase [Lachnospiraceae bacterium]
MEVKVARTAGFCFGVKRAVEMVYEEISKGGRIFTYGEIIHNEEVVRDLEEKGVRVLETKEELYGLSDCTVIIRSHGVSKEIYEILNKCPGVRIVDATCPFVARIHEIVEQESAEGKEIVVIGDKAHPEVEGIIGFSSGPVKALQTSEEAEAFKPLDGRKVCIVSQTTFNFNKFKDLVEIFEKKGYSIRAVNTICSATEQRQKEAREISS